MNAATITAISGAAVAIIGALGTAIAMIRHVAGPAHNPVPAPPSQQPAAPSSPPAPAPPAA